MGDILFEAIKIQPVDNFISAMFLTQQNPSWFPLVYSCKWETRGDFTPRGRSHNNVQSDPAPRSLRYTSYCGKDLTLFRTARETTTSPELPRCNFL